mgnify:CR=1 FL=1
MAGYEYRFGVFLRGLIMGFKWVDFGHSEGQNHEYLEQKQGINENV